MSTASNTDKRDRDLMVRAARGFIAEIQPATFVAGAGGLGTGVASYAAIGLLAGDLISTLTISLQVAGTALTLAKMGIYSKTGAQLAVSGDQSAAWMASTGVKTVTLPSPYAVPTTDVYYLAALIVGTTGPSLVRGCGGNAFGQFALSGFLAHYYGQSGLADLPSQATFGTGFSTAHCFWCGVS